MVVVSTETLAHRQIPHGSDRRQFRRLVVFVHCYTSFAFVDSPAAGSGDGVWAALPGGALEQAVLAEHLDERLDVLLSPRFGNAERVDQGLCQLLRRPLLRELPH